MHSPTEAANALETSAPAAMHPEMELASITPEPAPVSPVGFSLMAGLIGLAGGMVLAPWLERWYHKNIKHDVEESNEQ
jgi:hypothetical protein